jgi:hypothetical protein
MLSALFFASFVHPFMWYTFSINAKYKDIDVSVGENTNILSYADAFDIAEYAIPAMQWACGAGVIQGIEQNNTMHLAPQGNAVRSQSAAVIYRFYTEIMK